MKRTRLSVCRRKIRYPTLAAATAASVRGGWLLRPYRCDRCDQFHLTSRRRGRHTPQDIRAALLPSADTSGSEEIVL